jgi:hypothetical protein
VRTLKIYYKNESLLKKKVDDSILSKIVINLCRKAIVNKIVTHMVTSKNSCNKFSDQFKLKA